MNPVNGDCVIRKGTGPDSGGHVEM
ncbi:hypothetical protein C5167_022516 [Papaver somniferum]|uniref:Uncharacterized protein n=1 Tax=Papaver somniferum TaxID=3469 RepID=A0A4Y7JLY8_PAPSO|nr:hypothetical protein C5167_022516 [Papaver somniferum]